MPAPIIVDDLIDQIRDQLDENNSSTISDPDILQALNRAQDYASSILVKQYPEPLLIRTSSSTVGGQEEYDMPEDLFEQRLQKLEIIEQGIAREIRRINYRDITWHETSAQVTFPKYYYIVGRKFYLLPKPSAAKELRMWYIRELDPLVKAQGRVTTVDVANNYVIVNSIGDDLTTANTNLNNYINIVDAQTGKIKSSMQIQSIDTTSNKITFKSTPDRPSVYNRPISGTIDSAVELDDYLCISRGNCIPYLKKPLSNFVIQFTVVELLRKLGEPVSDNLRALKDFEEEIRSTWAGRELSLRVKRRSQNWLRRIYNWR